jgi:hypothetical protein
MPGSEEGKRFSHRERVPSKETILRHARPAEHATTPLPVDGLPIGPLLRPCDAARMYNRMAPRARVGSPRRRQAAVWGIINDRVYPGNVFLRRKERVVENIEGNPEI